MKVFIQGKSVFFQHGLVLDHLRLLRANGFSSGKTCGYALGRGGSIFSETEAPELTEEAEKAIERGLKFLISNQNKDGSWSSQDPENEGGSNYAIAGTSLGLMAFMVEGHFPGFGPYGQALDRAKDYLLKRAKDSPTGAMGVKMYEIGLFTIAMSELWGMTSDPEDNKEIQEALERVVEIILRSQNPLGGWRYAPRPDAGQDTSVTATVFVSLASAREAGVLVPAETIERVTGYLRDQAFDEAPGRLRVPRQRLHHFLHRRWQHSAQLAGNRDTEWVAAALNSARKRSENVFPQGQRSLLLLPLLCHAGDGSGRRGSLCQMVSENPRCSHQFATTQRILAGKGKGLSAQDAYGDHHSRDSQPVYPVYQR